MIKDKDIREVEVYSAGTLDWDKHPRDPVMIRIAGEYGYTLKGETTCITRETLDKMDLILVMTSGHQEEVKKVTETGSLGQSTPFYGVLLRGGCSFARPTLSKRTCI